MKKSVKIKRTDFKNDSDLISEALYDKHIIDKYLLQMDPHRQHEVEQGVLEFLSKILYVCK